MGMKLTHLIFVRHVDLASAEEDRQNNQAMVEIKDNLKKAIFTHTFEGFVDFATAFDGSKPSNPT